MSLHVDARARKLVADVADVRVDLALSALAIALGSAMVMVWQAPPALVLPLVAVVAIGAGDGFAATTSRVEGAFFGMCAAIVGLLLSCSVALVGGAWPSVSHIWSGVWLVGAMLVSAASASFAARAAHPESRW